MTPTKEQIESEAENEYPFFFVDGSSSAHGQALKRKGFIVGVEWALSQPSDAVEFAVWLSLNTDNQDSAGSYLKEIYYLYSKLYQIFLKEKQK